jgi:hypothetical protein
VYDDKINPCRTNPVWQLIQQDYSVNNAFYTGETPTTYDHLPNITKHNAYGLPTKYVRNEFYGSHQLFGIPFYDSLEVVYDCDLSNVKLK